MKTRDRILVVLSVLALIGVGMAVTLAASTPGAASSGIVERASGLVATAREAWALLDLAERVLLVNAALGAALLLAGLRTDDATARVTRLLGGGLGAEGVARRTGLPRDAVRCVAAQSALAGGRPTGRFLPGGGRIFRSGSPKAREAGLGTQLDITV